MDYIAVHALPSKTVYPTQEKLNWNDVLHKACLNGKLKLAEFAIQQGATDLQMGFENACWSGHFIVAQHVFDQGACDVEDAFCGACSIGRLDSAKWLAKKGARNWNRALVVAFEHGHEELFRWLCSTHPIIRKPVIVNILMNSEYIDTDVRCATFRL